MKIKVKSLKQIESTIEIASDGITIKDLKNEIEKILDFDSDQLKLLYKGAVLDDSKKLQEYNIQEDKVLIMVNAKKRIKNIPSLNKKEEQKKEEINPEYAEKLQQIIDMDMGIDPEMAKKALIVAKGDSDLAIDYCLEGIPEELLIEQNVSKKKQTSGDALQKIASVTKCICHDNPSSLGPFLQNLGENAPELLNLIRDKEEEFKKIIDAPVNDQDLQILNEYSEEIGLSGLGRGNNRGGGRSAVNPVALPSANGDLGGDSNQSILTDKDKEAIRQLTDLGFPEDVCKEAYLDNQKNPEMAANYLLGGN